MVFCVIITVVQIIIMMIFSFGWVMYQLEIKNCNNINNAKINIEKGTLNIKFAINGTGKSTIAKAIMNQYSDLSFLKTFGKSELPTITSDVELKNVVLFDDDFVNNVVFNGSNVIDNAFEVFIKSEKYDEQREIINKLLYELKQELTENENLKQLGLTSSFRTLFFTHFIFPYLNLFQFLYL